MKRDDEFALIISEGVYNRETRRRMRYFQKMEVEIKQEVAQQPEGENARKLQGLLELCNRERFDGLDEFGKSLQDSMTFENPITGPTNKDGMRAFHTSLWTAFPDFNYDVTRTLSQGDTVVAECTFKGTHKADLMGIPATERTVALPLAFLVDFANGKIQKWTTYLDTGTLMRQLGKAP
jgi:steroid delta-isomerase-like uncharacterized protein